MGGQVSLFTPAVNRVLHDTKVMRDLLCGYPRLRFHNYPPTPVGIDETGLSSSKLNHKRLPT